MTHDLSNYYQYGLYGIAICVVLSIVLLKFDINGKIWTVILYSFIVSISYLIILAIVESINYSKNSEIYIQVENAKEFNLLINGKFADKKDLKIYGNSIEFELYGDINPNRVILVNDRDTVLNDNFDKGIWAVNLIPNRVLVISEVLYGSHTEQEQKEALYYKSDIGVSKFKVTSNFSANIYAFNSEPPQSISKKVRGRGRGFGRAIINLLVNKFKAKKQIENQKYYSIKTQDINSNLETETEINPLIKAYEESKKPKPIQDLPKDFKLDLDKHK